MIRNFDEVKAQLASLADVINAFKSEAVQLRLVEIIFDVASDQPDEEEPADSPINRRVRRPREAKRSAAKSGGESTRSTESKAESSLKKKGSRAAPSTFGAQAALNRLIDDGFFSDPKALPDIVTHVKNKYAKAFDQSDFSGKLAAMARDGRLKRDKNKDGQYAYQKAAD